jgi:hypothetical protein
VRGLLFLRVKFRCVYLGLEFRVQSLGLRVCCFWFRVLCGWGLGSRVESSS